MIYNVYFFHLIDHAPLFQLEFSGKQSLRHGFKYSLCSGHLNPSDLFSWLHSIPLSLYHYLFNLLEVYTHILRPPPPPPFVPMFHSPGKTHFPGL